MGKLVKCKVCKKEVANGARVCPHCGISEPSTTFIYKLFYWFIAVIAFIVVATIIIFPITKIESLFEKTVLFYFELLAIITVLYVIIIVFEKFVIWFFCNDYKIINSLNKIKEPCQTKLEILKENENKKDIYEFLKNEYDILISKIIPDLEKKGQWIISFNIIIISTCLSILFQNYSSTIVAQYNIYKIAITYLVWFTIAISGISIGCLVVTLFEKENHTYNSLSNQINSNEFKEANILSNIIDITYNGIKEKQKQVNKLSQRIMILYNFTFISFLWIILIFASIGYIKSNIENLEKCERLSVKICKIDNKIDKNTQKGNHLLMMFN